MQHHRQKGFTLLELSLTTILMGFAVLAMIEMQGQQTQLESARSIAQIYKRVNEAAGSYMANFYGQLINVKPECSKVSYTSDGPSASAAVSGCSVALSLNGSGTTFTVANAMQPTLAELSSLGLLSEAAGVQYVNSLPLPTYASASGDPLQVMDSSNRPAPEAFGVVVQKVCIAAGSTSGGTPITNSSTSCSSYDLRSLALNLQPYKLSKSSEAGEIMLYQILQSTGADAYLSDLTGNSELVGRGDSPDRVITNPLRSSKADKGVPYILAMRNGFGSSGYDRFVRRDGTQILTAAWNVGNQDITGIKDLKATTGEFSNFIKAVNGIFSGKITAADAEISGLLKATTVEAGTVNATNVNATTVSASKGTFSQVKTGTLTANTGTFSGEISAASGNFTGNVSAASGSFTGDVGAASGNFTGNLTAGGSGTFAGALSASDVTASGTVRGGTGVFGNFTANVSAALKATSAYVSGALTVAGDLVAGTLQVSGLTELLGQTNISKLYLPNTHRLGDTCDSTKESLTRTNSSSIDYSTPKALRLLMCDPVTNRWVQPLNYDSQLATINTSITDLGTNINSVSSALASTSGDLLNKITKNTTDIKTVSEAVATLRQDMNTAVSGLQNSVTVISSGVTTLNGQVAGLNTSVSNLGASITNLNSSASSLDTRVKSLETNYLRYDVINVDMDAYSGGMVRSRVWSRTPWKCNSFGTLGYYNDQVKLNSNSSDNQPGGSSRTPPILMGIDQSPSDDQLVWDVNCGQDSDNSYSANDNYWYVGISAIKANTAGGNACRSGLGSQQTATTLPTSSFGSVAKCYNFNYLAPNFSTKRIAARFIAFTRN